MKKLLLIALVFTCSLQSQAQAGRVRIYFTGFDCYRETWDDILHTDGKGDEVYFNFGFTIADRNGNTKNKYEKRTGVYGDATGQFSNRISVGSCVDIFGGARGGIKAGDNYRCNDIIGEYDLADGDIISIVPTGWEYDPIADNMNSFTSTIGGLYNSINQKLAPIMIGFHVLTGNLDGVVRTVASLGLPKIVRAGGDQGELGKPGTRPIGMEKYGDFSPKLVTLNTPNLSSIANSNFGNGTGVIAVNYDENAVGNARDHGNYTILLKVEFTPRSAAPPPAPSNNNNNVPPPPPPSSSTNNNMNPGMSKPGGIKALPVATSSSVNGTWAGTWGNGQSNNPNYYSFRLNTDGMEACRCLLTMEQ
jgi:hypothetical protein